MTSSALPSATIYEDPTSQQPLEATLRATAPANDTMAGARSTAVLRRAARAIHDRRVCLVRYASEPGGAPSARAIEPLAVISTRGSLGVLAWCRLRRDLRTFRIDRVTSLTVTAERFSDHPDLALERFISQRRRDLP